ncbi:MAG: DUF5106 domain-containing protein [Rikenellaceae bacterium]
MYKYIIIVATAVILSTKAFSQTFTLPDVPASLNTAQQRAEYVITKYWDCFNFKDTTLISNEEYTEQAFVDFVNILLNIPKDLADRGIDTMMNLSSINQEMYIHFMSMSEKYMYDIASPLRNEELYITVLNHIIANNKLDELLKLRSRYQLEMALKNRIGSTATDFTFTTARLTKQKLSDIKGEYTLLMFYNPDCDECKKTKQYIMTSEVFNNLQKSENRRLSVLAFYADDDIASWRKHLIEMPRNWTVGYDATCTFRSNGVYELMSLPCLYLLDKDKKVILKNTTVENIETFLSKKLF